MEKQRKIWRWARRIALAFAAYVMIFLFCTKAAQCMTYVEGSAKIPSVFLWISENEVCNTVGYFIFYPPIKLLESTGTFQFLYPLPPNFDTCFGCGAKSLAAHFKNWVIAVPSIIGAFVCVIFAWRSPSAKKKILLGIIGAILFMLGLFLAWSDF